VANYIFTYLATDGEPSRAEMDSHIDQQGSWTTARILETMWYIGTTDPSETVTAFLTGILSDDASYLVAACSHIDSRNLEAVPT
jgi:hypothetical protein